MVWIDRGFSTLAAAFVFWMLWEGWCALRRVETEPAAVPDAPRRKKESPEPRRSAPLYRLDGQRS